MITETKKTDTIITNLNDDKTSTVGMSAKGADIAGFFLRDKIYTQKELAVVREYMTNAIDEHIKHGVERKVDVKVPTEVDPVFKVRDYANGLSDEGVRQVFGMYFESTKQGDSKQIGGFGIGSKAGYAYAKSFIVTSWHDGFKTIYLFSLEGGGYGKGTIRELNKEKSDEPSGLEVSVTVKSDHVYNFREAIGFMYSTTEKHVNLSDELRSQFGKIKEVTKYSITFEGAYKHTYDDYVFGGFVPYKVSKMYRIKEKAKKEIRKNGGNAYAVNYAIQMIDDYRTFFRVPTTMDMVSVSREELEHTDVAVKTLKDIITKYGLHLIKELETDAYKVKTLKQAVAFMKKFGSRDAFSIQNFVKSMRDVKAKELIMSVMNLEMLGTSAKLILQMNAKGDIDSSIADFVGVIKLFNNNKLLIVKLDDRKPYGERKSFVSLHNRVRSIIKDNTPKGFKQNYVIVLEDNEDMDLSILDKAGVEYVIEEEKTLKPIGKSVFNYEYFGIGEAKKKRNSDLILKYNLEDGTVEKVETFVKDSLMFFSIAWDIDKLKNGIMPSTLDVRSHLNQNDGGCEYKNTDDIVETVKELTDLKEFYVCTRTQRMKAKKRGVKFLNDFVSEDKAKKHIEKMFGDFVEENYVSATFEKYVFVYARLKNVMPEDARKNLMVFDRDVNKTFSDGDYARSVFYRQCKMATILVDSCLSGNHINFIRLLKKYKNNTNFKHYISEFKKVIFGDSELKKAFVRIILN